MNEDAKLGVVEPLWAFMLCQHAEIAGPSEQAKVQVVNRNLGRAHSIIQQDLGGDGLVGSSLDPDGNGLLVAGAQALQRAWNRRLDALARNSHIEAGSGHALGAGIVDGDLDGLCAAV